MNLPCWAGEAAGACAEPLGNARLRRTLWIAGQVAIRQRENGFRHKFEHYIARDRDNPYLRRKAMTAITAKMVRVVHAVV